MSGGYQRECEFDVGDLVKSDVIDGHEGEAAIVRHVEPSGSLLRGFNVLIEFEGGGCAWCGEGHIYPYEAEALEDLAARDICGV